jgi:hypothetical protein
VAEEGDFRILAGRLPVASRVGNDLDLAIGATDAVVPPTTSTAVSGENRIGATERRATRRPSRAG